MSVQFNFGKGALLAAAASISLFAAPQMAAAQPGGPDYDQGGYNNQSGDQGGTYYDPCARSQANRSVIGGLLGAAAGATLGNSVTHGGAKLGGAIIGGVAGAAAGASIGHATAACQPGQPGPYYAGDPQQGPDYGPRQGPDYGPPPGPDYGPQQGPDYGPQQGPDYGPPPPPPPPGAYIPNDDNRYAGPGGDPGYREPSRERCQMVESRVFFPDGTTDSRSVQACRDRDGRWRVADDGPPGRD